jgi:HSP20 family protein
MPERIDRGMWLPLQRRLNRLFEEFFSDLSPVFSGREQGFFQPRVNFEENEREIRLAVELPGVEQDDLQLELVEGGIMIRGERRDEVERKVEGGRRITEQSYGMFERFIPIGAEIVPDKVDAKIRNGILNIVLPKSDSARQRVRRVPIRQDDEAPSDKERGRQSRQQQEARPH